MNSQILQLANEAREDYILYGHPLKDYGIEINNLYKIVNLASGDEYLKGFINVDADKSVKADIYCDLFGKLPFKDNSIDAVYCKNFFEHMPNPLNLLLEIKRILKKGGKAVLITSNASYFIYHFPRRKGHHDYYNESPRRQRHLGVYARDVKPIDDRHYFMFQKGHLKAFTETVKMNLVALDYFIVDETRSRNRLFQKIMGFFIGKKFAYSDFYWEIQK